MFNCQFTINRFLKRVRCFQQDDVANNQPSNVVKHCLHVCLLHSRLEGAGQNCHEPPEAGAPLDVLLVFIDESVGGAQRVLGLLLALKDRVLNKKIFSQQNILNVVLSHYLPTSLNISLSRFLKSWHRIKMFSWSSV